MSDTSRMVFSLLTFLVAVPSGIKVFNWVASMYKGSIQLDSPMLFVLSFIFLFSIGGLTGLLQGALATNIQVHGTYFIVAHFHYVMFGGTGFAFFAALHYWYPKMFGTDDEREAREDHTGFSCSSASTPSTSPCSSSAGRACRGGTMTICRNTIPVI